MPFDDASGALQHPHCCAAAVCVWTEKRQHAVAMGVPVHEVMARVVVVGAVLQQAKWRLLFLKVATAAYQDVLGAAAAAVLVQPAVVVARAAAGVVGLELGWRLHCLQQHVQRCA